MSKQPSILTIPYLEDASPYFLALSSLASPVWLDSGKPYSLAGRYDILAAAPCNILTNPSIQELQLAVDELSSNNSGSTNADIPFCGGAIGYFNYEYRHQHFSIQANKDCSPSVFGIFEWALIQDHDKRQSYLYFLPQCEKRFIANIEKRCKNLAGVSNKEFSVSSLHANLKEEAYYSAFEKIKDYIINGDSYQINYAQRFSGKFSGSACATYLALRKVMPSPYSAYANLTDEHILSFSPERFIQVENGLAKTQPIKGTITRGNSVEDDAKLAAELQNSEKNRAENVMIVDLLRNDFSQHCKPFSVKTPALFQLESFANVHHLVSTVTGILEDNTSALEFFMACFPGGSITGAPKKRAMEIIDELEEHSRNIYCGSMCYLSTHDRFDSSITIRTLLIKSDNIFCWGGGGIVADSIASEEYRESIDKIAVLLEALRQSD